ARGRARQSELCSMARSGAPAESDRVPAGSLPMSKPLRILRNIGIGLAALIVVVVVAAFFIVQTNWFREYVKGKIITAAEDGTGGRVEIGSFSFDPLHFKAVLTNIVIHGHEPADAAPYLQAKRAEVDIRLFTSIHHLLDIAYLGLDTPQVNIMVNADGTSNVPTPKTKSQSNETPLESIVNLAVGRADISHGLLTFNSQQHPLDVRANNLHVRLDYNVLKQGYQGELSLQPLYVAQGRNTPVVFTISIPVAFTKDHIDFQNARIATPASEILINGSL